MVFRGGRIAVLLLAMITPTWGRSDEPLPDAKTLASRVTIHRDDFGVAHIDGADDEAVVFGFAYAQAEDFYWQVEDTFLMCLGRYAEVYGQSGLHNDLLNRAFRIVPRSQQDFDAQEPAVRRACAAYVAGLNYYLENNPQVPRRGIDKYEPWHLLALTRHIFMHFTMMTKFVPRQYMGADPRIPATPGLNAWAIGPTRTKSGGTILFCNPHQPQYGYGQFYEAHLRSREGDWDFSGATFFGSPMPGIGHNRYLGWTHTVNRPGTLNFWRVRFDDPNQPDQYRFGDQTKTAEKWSDTVRVKRGSQIEEQTHQFRRTVHGPLIAKVGDNEFLAMNIARLMEVFPTRQHLRMVRARNLDEFKAAMALLDLPFFNTIYADVEGNIFFAYNANVPKRDPSFDWSGTLDGSDTRTMWGDVFAFADLPQVTNPLSGWLQSCNSSPYTSTDDGNPLADNFPDYLVANDRNEDKLRSKVSRMLLRQLDNATFEQVEELAFDTTMYWPLTELPKLREEFVSLTQRNSELANRARPYFDHLLDWDCKNRVDCTQSTLCEAWFRELHGSLYPPDAPLQYKFIENPDQKFAALITAADGLAKTYGDWKVPWGDIHRLQRHPDVADFFAIPFSDKKESLPCLGVPGPLGAVFTQYYTPSVYVPFVKEMRKQYAVLGTSYISVFEFTKQGIRGGTLTHFGSSADPKSPHFFDQAKLHSDGKLKPELYDWDQIQKVAKRTYHPGQ